jgi:hypothetical protein
VTVIATGFDRRSAAAQRPAAAFASSFTPRDEPERTPEPTVPSFDMPNEALEIPSFLREE